MLVTGKPTDDLRTRIAAVAAQHDYRRQMDTRRGFLMSALNWATIAMSVVAIAFSVDSIRISRKNRRR